MTKQERELLDAMIRNIRAEIALMNQGVLNTDEIEVEGQMVTVPTNIIKMIPCGYSWDGCTLAPDFKSTYYASCVHDALYQYKINRKLSDKVFYNILKENGFKGAKLYYLGTRIFGNLFY